MSFADDFGHNIPDIYDTVEITTDMSDVHLKGTIDVETDKAWLAITENGKTWLPKSQCDYYEEIQEFEIPYWLFPKLVYLP